MDHRSGSTLHTQLGLRNNDKPDQERIMQGPCSPNDIGSIIDGIISGSAMHDLRIPRHFPENSTSFQDKFLAFSGRSPRHFQDELLVLFRTNSLPFFARITRFFLMTNIHLFSGQIPRYFQDELHVFSHDKYPLIFRTNVVLFC